MKRFPSVVLVLVAAGTILAASWTERPARPGFLPAAQLPEHLALPNPFLRPDGTRVKTIEEWSRQRQYLKSLVTHYKYGKMPPTPENLAIRSTLSRSAFEGAAVEEHYTLSVSRGGRSVDLAIALFRPSGEKRRFPTIIKNCRVLFDRETARERYRGIIDYDLPAAREAVDRGYLLCKFFREDLAVDQPNNRSEGVFPLYPEYDWGTIAVWAWGHQIVLDALDRLGLANLDQIVATGHSRGGQTATAAGIFDDRIDVVVPCTGGFGSCGTLRVRDPEDVRGKTDHVAHLKKYAPHWFHPRYYEFVGQQSRLPFDAHTLVSLIAPRPFLNTNATEDEYNNTLSMEAGLRTGRLVYKWMKAETWCRLHWRPGRHDQNDEDWGALFDFADEVFFGKKSKREFNQWVYPEFEPTLN